MSQFTIPSIHPIQITASAEEPVTLYNNLKSAPFYFSASLPLSPALSEGSVMEGFSATFRAPTFLIAAPGTASLVEQVPQPLGIEQAGGEGLTKSEIEALLNERNPTPTLAVTANSGTTYTLSGVDTILTLTSASPSIIMPTSPQAGKEFTLLLRQDASGSRVPVWSAGVEWHEGGLAPTLSTEPGATDIIEFVGDGAHWFAKNVSLNFHSSGSKFGSFIEGKSGLVAYYRFDETSGTELKDYSSKANKGEYKNAPALKQEGALTKSGLADSTDTAAQFLSASTQYATVPTNASLNVADTFTIIFFVKTIEGGLGTSRGIVGKATGTPYVRLGESNELELLKQSEHVVAHCGTVPNDGKWHMVALTKTGATITAEIDNVSTLGAVTNFTMGTSTEPLLIGTGYTTEEHGDFFLDELMIFNKVLTLKERQEIYTLAHGATEAETITQNFESGTLSGWNLAGVGTTIPVVQKATVHSGTYAAQFNLKEEQQRSELIFGGTGGTNFEPVTFVEGNTFTYKFWYYAKQVAWGKPGSSGLIWQCKSNGEGSPEFGLELWKYAGDHGEWAANPEGLFVAGYNAALGRYANVRVSSFALNTWHHVEIEATVSGLKAGGWVVHCDGVKVAEESGVNTMIPGRPFIYLKNGFYRGAVGYSGTTETFLDDCELIT